MAKFAPDTLDVDQLREEVISVYTQVAKGESEELHFNVGPRYAAELLGYSADDLASLPDATSASFAGVGNPHAVGSIDPGETVLDIGSGGGTDLLIAAQRVGSTGRAIGVDITDAMIAQVRRSADEMGLDNVEVREGDALSLPVEDESVDVVISNGVLNLTPNKLRAFREIERVLVPGGRVQIADIVIGRELSEGARTDIDLWSG